MANERMQYQAPTVYQSVKGPVQTDDGTGDFLRTAANVFLVNANEMGDRALRADLEQAKTDGQKIGYDAGKDFKPMQGGSLLSRQFNDSGIYAAAQKVDITTSESVGRMSLKFKADPNGLKNSLNAYGNSYVKDLPTAMQTPFRMQFDKMASSAIATAQSQKIELGKQNAAANWYNYDIKTQNAAEQFTQNMFAPGEEGFKAREALAVIRKNRMDALAGQGPMGSGAFSPVEIAKQNRAFDVEMIQAGVLSNFQKEVDNGNGANAYLNFTKGDMTMFAVDGDGDGVHSTKKITDILTNDEMEAVSSKMASHIGRVNSMREAGEKQAEKYTTDYNNAYLKNAYSKAYSSTKDKDGNTIVTGGDPIALQQLAAAAQADIMVSPDTLNKVLDLASKIGTGKIDNPVTTGNTWEAITTGKIQTIQGIPAEGVSDKTRIEMINKIDARQKGMDWSTSTRFKTAEQYADATLAPQKSAGMQMFGDDGSKKAAADRAEWSRRMIEQSMAAEASGLMPANPNALPVKSPTGPQQFDLYEVGKQIADEIKERRNKPAEVPPEIKAIDDQLAPVKVQMENPPKGATDDDIEAIAKQYRELNARRTKLMTDQMLNQGMQQ